MKTLTTKDIIALVLKNDTSDETVKAVADAQSVASTRASEYLKAFNKDSHPLEYRRRKAEWNAANEVVKAAASVSMEGNGRGKIRVALNTRHAASIGAKMKPDSIGYAAAETVRLAKLELARPFFASESLMISHETTLTVRELASIAKAERRVPYAAYEVRDDNSHVLTLKAAISWIESLDAKRKLVSKETTKPRKPRTRKPKAPVVLDAPAPVTQAPRKRAPRKVA